MQPSDELRKLSNKLKRLDRARQDSGRDSESFRLAGILEICRLLCSTLDLKDVLGRILDSALGLTGAQRGFIMLFDDMRELQMASSKFIRRTDMETESFVISRSVVNEVAGRGETIILNPVAESKAFSLKKSVCELGLNMIICLPLIAHQSMIGLIYLDSPLPGKRFTNVEIEILNSVAAMSALSIRNARLWENSIKDPLTSLYNAGYLHLKIEEEWLKAREGRDPAIVLILCVDRFGSFVDTYGSAKANDVLRQLASIITQTCRTEYPAFRFESNRFAVLLPSTGKREAEIKLAAIKKAVEAFPFTLGGKKTPLAVHAGLLPVSALRDSPGEIIREVDSILQLLDSKEGPLDNALEPPGSESEQEGKFIGSSKAAREIRQTIKKCAQVRASLLICGETGTGKGLTARLAHEMSPHKTSAFLTLNCASLPESLLESELFGYVRGAFTGAYQHKKGLIEMTHGGTLFLDNIENLPLPAQAKILQAVEDKTFLKLGGEREIHVDVRIIASTIRNLAEEVKQDRFRDDLYQRLNILSISLPPLRERREDILPLADYYLKYASGNYKIAVKGFGASAERSMMAYDWPGNIRELRYRIERAVIMNKNGTIEPDDLGLEAKQFSLNLQDNVDKIQEDLLKEALRLHKANISLVAKELGISRTTLYQFIRKYRIKAGDYEQR